MKHHALRRREFSSSALALPMKVNVNHAVFNQQEAGKMAWTMRRVLRRGAMA
jgi:hypothetical protein